MPVTMVVRTSPEMTGLRRRRTVSLRQPRCWVYAERGPLAILTRATDPFASEWAQRISGGRRRALACGQRVYCFLRCARTPFRLARRSALSLRRLSSMMPLFPSSTIMGSRGNSATALHWHGAAFNGIVAFQRCFAPPDTMWRRMNTRSVHEIRAKAAILR